MSAMRPAAQRLARSAREHGLWLATDFSGRLTRLYWLGGTAAVVVPLAGGNPALAGGLAPIAVIALVGGTAARVATVRHRRRIIDAGGEVQQLC
jgi:hypothetical protein